jgi:hypothetical protein
LLLGLTRRIFKKQDFESFVTNEDLKGAVNLVVDAIPKSVDEEKRKKALQELEAALIELGMPESVAKAHADGVAELVCGKSTIG